MKPINCKWVAYALLLVIIVAGSLQVYATGEQRNGDWVIETTQEAKKSMRYFSCAVTDVYVFFGYGDNGIIDAYDHKGNFTFSLRYTGSTKNRYMSIRAKENLLYVSSHSGTLYVFNGQQLEKTMSYDEAEQNGYDISWFNEGIARADKEYVYYLDEQGEWVQLMETPKEVSNRMPTIEISKERKEALAFAGLAFAFVAYVIFMIVILKKKTGDGSVSSSVDG